METYNRQDVLLLEKVYERFLPYITNHPNLALYTNLETPVCTNCGSESIQKRGIQHLKTLSYHRLWCSDCGTWMRARTSHIDKYQRANILTQAI